MKKIIFYLCLFCLITSCSKTIEKPENLLPEKEMAEIIAEFSIYGQSYLISSDVDNDNITRYILKQHKTTGEIFSDSYKYYLLDPDKMDKIFTKAQQIIKENNPKTKDYIDDKENKKREEEDKLKEKEKKSDEPAMR